MLRDDDESRSLRRFLVPVIISILLTVGVALFMVIPTLQSKSIAYLFLLEAAYVLNTLWIVKRL